MAFLSGFTGAAVQPARALWAEGGGASALAEIAGPRLTVAEAQDFSEKTLRRKTEEPERERTVLLVEDNPADAALVRDALNRQAVHCELLVLSDGEQAIGFLDEIQAGRLSSPDLIVLDLNLPKRSGWEVLERRQETDSVRAPVMILTSSDDERDRRHAAQLGASRYVRKPSRLADFMRLGAIFEAMLDQAE